MGKFTPLNDKDVRKVIVLRERAEGGFPRGGSGDRVVPLSKRRFLQEDRITSRRGILFSSREKIADNFTSPREKAGERHVSPTIPIFPRGRPSSLREEVTEKENHVRCIIPFVVSPGQRWHVVQHKNFPQRLSKT